MSNKVEMVVEGIFAFSDPQSHLFNQRQSDPILIYFRQLDILNNHWQPKIDVALLLGSKSPLPAVGNFPVLKKEASKEDANRAKDHFLTMKIIWFKIELLLL